MADRRTTTLLALAGFQVADAAACAAGLPQITESLDRVGCPEPVRKAIPVVKVASAVGLVVGTRRPAVAKLTLSALVAYFAVAVGFHLKAKDTPANTAPAALFGLLFAALLRGARAAVPA